MNGFVPITVAAQRAGYSYSMVQKMVKRGILAPRDFYGRALVRLQDVLDYRQQQSALGPAKHTPHRYRAETETTEEAADGAN